MRLSEILQSDVVDAGGSRVGAVRDVRGTREGKVLGSFGAAIVATGLIVSPHRTIPTFGYDDSRASGPRLIQMLISAVHRKSVFVPWAAVASVEPGLITLNVNAGELGPVPPMSIERSPGDQSSSG